MPCLAKNERSKGKIGNSKSTSLFSFAPYEIPQNPNLEIDTLKESVEESVDKVFKYLEKKLYG